MLQIRYKIKQIIPNIFAIIVPDDYTRAMLFLRIQEFYESKNKKFRGKNFSFWEYKKWYSSLNQSSFTYTKDWEGFNLPLKVAVLCQKVSSIETPYDKEINKILNFIQKKCKNSNSYLIGIKSISIDSESFRHELCHALYYTNKKYKRTMDSITKSIKKKSFIKIKNELKKMGYCESVIKDEIQAYISSDRKNKLAKIGSLDKKIINRYKNVLKNIYMIKLFNGEKNNGTI